VERQGFFARMLTEKLLAFACGRLIESQDRLHIDKICQSIRSDGYPMRTLIEQIVLSEVFQSK
jgi:Protein of unknown function (DUF1585)